MACGGITVIPWIKTNLDNPSELWLSLPMPQWETQTEVGTGFRPELMYNVSEFTIKQFDTNQTVYRFFTKQKSIPMNPNERHITAKIT